MTTRRIAVGAAWGAVLALSPALSAPLGRLAPALALLVVLPPLALALESFGWRRRLASRLARVGSPVGRLIAGYLTALATSGLLSLDVAAVGATSVGIEAAGKREAERRWQLGGAILGANVGSLLFPFSNLTNLVLVAASGLGFATYVAAAAGPQLAAAIAVGLLLALRSRAGMGPRLASDRVVPSQPEAQSPASGPASDSGTGRAALLAAGVALAGAGAAIGFGVVGLDMALPFAASAGILTAAALVSRRLEVGSVARSLPLGGLAIVLGAALFSGAIDTAASTFFAPGATLPGLLVALGVGGVLAAAFNNLPAAAFGAAWLAHGQPATIVAFLLGTNVAAMATPHGSMATILARGVGARHGVATPAGAYIRSAWRYALAGTLAGVLVLALVSR